MIVFVLAWANMIPNLVAAAVILGLGVAVLRSLSSKSGKGEGASGGWTPTIALLAGPLVSILWWATDVFPVNRESYVSDVERYETLPPILFIGIIVGLCMSIVFAATLSLRTPGQH